MLKNIDIKKLTRDYNKFPLKIEKEYNNGAKRYEKPNIDDLKYLYLDLNLSVEELVKYFKVLHIHNLEVLLRKYKIKKSRELRNQIEKRKCFEKFGVINVFQLKEIKNKSKQTKIRKYNDENYTNYQKARNTCLKKYGVKFYNQTIEGKEKLSKSLLNKTKEEWNKIVNLRKITNIKKYGSISPLGNKEILKKYKDDYKKKTGYENPSQNPDIKSKKIQTCIEKYGVENVFQVKEIQEKYKKTLLKKYGIDNISKLENIKLLKNNTMKKNNSYKKSSPEDLIFELLKIKFQITENERQYYCQEYPFKCDFYIPSKKLFIEYQGTWSHGGQPFNPNIKKHKEILLDWENRSKNSKYYKNAIETWTKKDPLKRKIAKENNINYLEFFNLKEFMEWYNEQ